MTLGLECQRGASEAMTSQWSNLRALFNNDAFFINFPLFQARRQLQQKPLVSDASHTCRDACRDRLPVVAGKTFPAFPAHAHPQIYVSGKGPLVCPTNPHGTVLMTVISLTGMTAFNVWQSIYPFYFHWCRVRKEIVSSNMALHLNSLQTFDIAIRWQ